MFRACRKPRAAQRALLKANSCINTTPAKKTFDIRFNSWLFSDPIAVRSPLRAAIIKK